MEKKYIFFDLDGTLTDSADGIINSVIYALKSYGMEAGDREALRAFVGPPLAGSFSKYYGFDEKKSLEAVERYREYFREKGLFENQVYPGIREMLEELKKRGAVLMLATSKPELFSRQILEHFDLMQYFDFLGGATMEEKRTAKADVIRYVLESCGLEDCLSQIRMVGDREYDIIGARENSIRSVGVLYGYGDRRELEEAGADTLAETVEELKKLLIQWLEEE